MPATVAVVFTVICIWLAQTLNIWQDEAYSLHTTARGFFDALRQGIGFEAQAPLYFGLLALWRLLNVSATHARLLSILFSLVTLYAVWDFSRRYIRLPPWILLSAVAFNPYTVWAAVEIRPYAASIAFSAVLLLLFFRGFVDSKPEPLARAAFIVVAVAGTYTQYYVALLVPACGVALLAVRRFAAVRAYVIASAIFVIALLPLAYVLPLQLHAYDAFAAAFKIPGYVMATVGAEYPFPHDWIGTWADMRVFNVLYLAIILVPAGIVASSRPVFSLPTKVLLAIVVTLLVSYTLIIVAAHVHVLIPRHSLVILVPLIALVFATIADVLPSRRRLALCSYLVVFVAFSLLTYWHTYHSLSKTGDWRRVGAFLNSAAGLDDAIAVFDAETELPFRYYFHGKNVVQPIPRALSFAAFDEESFVLHGEGDVASSLGRLAAGHPTVWLVESNVCARQGVFFGCDYLNSYVKTHFLVLQTSVFNGSVVLKLRSRHRSSTES